MRMFSRPRTINTHNRLHFTFKTTFSTMSLAVHILCTVYIQWFCKCSSYNRVRRVNPFSGIPLKWGFQWVLRVSRTGWYGLCFSLISMQPCYRCQGILPWRQRELSWSFNPLMLLVTPSSKVILISPKTDLGIFFNLIGPICRSAEP